MTSSEESAKRVHQHPWLDLCLAGLKGWSYIMAAIFVMFAVLGLAVIPLNLSMVAAGIWEPVGWKTHVYFPVAGATGAAVFASLGYAAGRLRGDSGVI